MTSAAARYDGHSEWYDEHFGSGHRPAEELAFLREALGTGHGQPCLDLACGTGLWAEPIAAAGYRVAGLDISADQLRFARRRHVAVARADSADALNRALDDAGFRPAAVRAGGPVGQVPHDAHRPARIAELLVG